VNTHAREDDDMDTDTLPTAQDHLEQHAAYCRAVISARAPEFQPGEIAAALRADSGAWNPADDERPDPGESVWLALAERVLDAVEALEERLARLETTINGGQDDDDERGRGPDR
jgi:hypothetical protein